MNLATVGVLHVAMALEDPFDNQGLDGIYVDEALFEAEQVDDLLCHLSLLDHCGTIQAWLRAPLSRPILLLRSAVPFNFCASSAVFSVVGSLGAVL